MNLSTSLPVTAKRLPQFREMRTLIPISAAAC